MLAGDANVRNIGCSGISTLDGKSVNYDENVRIVRKKSSFDGEVIFK